MLFCFSSLVAKQVKRATCTDFVAKSRTTPVLSTFWKDFSQLAQPNFLQDRFSSWVVKRASSFCSNVVKQVVRFYARFILARGENDLLPFPFKY